MAEAGLQERRGADLARGTQNPIAMKLKTPLENDVHNLKTKGQQNIPKPYTRWPRRRNSKKTRRPRQPRATKTAQTTARQKIGRHQRRPSSRADQMRVDTRNIPKANNPNKHEASKAALHRKEASQKEVKDQGHVTASDTYTQTTETRTIPTKANEGQRKTSIKT